MEQRTQNVLMETSTDAFEAELTSSGMYVGEIDHQEDHYTYHMGIVQG